MITVMKEEITNHALSLLLRCGLATTRVSGGATFVGNVAGTIKSCYINICAMHLSG